MDKMQEYDYKLLHHLEHNRKVAVREMRKRIAEHELELKFMDEEIAELREKLKDVLVDTG